MNLKWTSTSVPNFNSLRRYQQMSRTWWRSCCPPGVPWYWMAPVSSASTRPSEESGWRILARMSSIGPGRISSFSRRLSANRARFSWRWNEKDGRSNIIKDGSRNSLSTLAWPVTRSPRGRVATAIALLEDAVSWRHVADLTTYFSRKCYTYLLLLNTLQILKST